MNVSNLLSRDYERMDTWSSGKNEPKTNPNEPKTNPIKANKMPKQTQYKANFTILPATRGDLLKIYFLLKMNHPARY